MAEIKITTIVVGLVMLGFLLSGMYTFIGDVGQGYNVTVDDDQYLAVYDKTTEISDDISASYQNVTQAEISKTSAFFIGANLAWSGLKTAVTAPITLTSIMISTLTEQVGVPPWAVGLATVFITLMVLMGTLAFLRGWQP